MAFFVLLGDREDWDPGTQTVVVRILLVISLSRLRSPTAISLSHVRVSSDGPVLGREVARLVPPAILSVGRPRLGRSKTDLP